MPPRQDDDLTGDLPLMAYRLPWVADMPLVPAEIRRDWMEATTLRNAVHCLPLLIANQSGWCLLNSHDFRVEWDGGDTAAALRVEYAGGAAPFPAGSHFGFGILTFQVPFLFRTPPGWNLLARGPANLPKDAASPLEGIIETDWATVTFTMNWQITRPGVVVPFAAGEPICMLVPQRRAMLERFGPRIAPLEQMPDAQDYLAWRRGRHLFKQGNPAARAEWQHDYMAGRDVRGEPVSQHQRRLRLRSFSR